MMAAIGLWYSHFLRDTFYFWAAQTNWTNFGWQSNSYRSDRSTAAIIHQLVVGYFGLSEIQGQCQTRQYTSMNKSIFFKESVDCSLNGCASGHSQADRLGDIKGWVSRQNSVDTWFLQCCRLKQPQPWPQWPRPSFKITSAQFKLVS